MWRLRRALCRCDRCWRWFLRGQHWCGSTCRRRVHVVLLRGWGDEPRAIANLDTFDARFGLGAEVSSPLLQLTQRGLDQREFGRLCVLAATNGLASNAVLVANSAVKRLFVACVLRKEAADFLGGAMGCTARRLPRYGPGMWQPRRWVQCGWPSEKTEKGRGTRRDDVNNSTQET
jgi:hypothetical protein